MKANSKISSIEYFYSYFNRCIIPSVFGTFAIIYLSATFHDASNAYSLVFEAVLFFCTALAYKFLHAIRRLFLSIGNNRFDLYAIVTYVSLISCNFINTKSISFEYVVFVTPGAKLPTSPV